MHIYFVKNSKDLFNQVTKILKCSFVVSIETIFVVVLKCHTKTPWIYIYWRGKF